MGLVEFNAVYVLVLGTELFLYDPGSAVGERDGTE